MRDTPVRIPEYSAAFRCIGPACEDSCCVGWTVPIDERTLSEYKALPPSPLRVLIEQNIVPLARNEDGSAPAQFAHVKLTESRACPFLNAEKLCQIQVEHGEKLLSVTCATYPRMAHTIDGLRETALTLSCPEAARLVLLSQNLLEAHSGREFTFRWQDETEGSPVAELIGYFWPIRAFVMDLLRNRAYPLWQRLFLLGMFTKRLAALARGEAQRSFPAILRDFEAAVASGTLRDSMDAIPADLGLQLDMVLRLAGLPLPRSHVGQRFLDVVEALKKGLGYAPDSTLALLIEHYGDAYERWYAPFFRANPHVLENLLINAVVRTLFPFGTDLGANLDKPGALFHVEQSFAMLVVQFALLKGLLIGVSGSHREGFCAGHVIHTIQAATKHFEHHPRFLEEAHALLVSSGLNNLRGLTMLVRN